MGVHRDERDIVKNNEVNTYSLSLCMFSLKDMSVNENHTSNDLEIRGVTSVTTVDVSGSTSFSF